MADSERFRTPTRSKKILFEEDSNDDESGSENEGVDIFSDEIDSGENTDDSDTDQAEIHTLPVGDQVSAQIGNVVQSSGVEIHPLSTADDVDDQVSAQIENGVQSSGFEVSSIDFDMAVYPSQIRRCEQSDVKNEIVQGLDTMEIQIDVDNKTLQERPSTNSDMPLAFESDNEMPTDNLNRRGRNVFRGRASRSRVGPYPKNGRPILNSNAEMATASSMDTIFDIPFEQSAVNPAILDWKNDTIRGKDHTVWKKNPPNVPRNVPLRNIIHASPGPINDARNANSPLDCFKLFFTTEMVNMIVQRTNEQMDRIRPNYRDKKSTHNPVTPDEIYAFLGLLVFSATMKDNHLSTSDLFDTDLSGTRYKSVMSQSRFEFIIRHLRFDDKETRPERVETDRLAPIRELWDKFIENCQKNYEPGHNVTIDNQLLAFRGKCRFRIHIPNKAAKCGIKIVSICDSDSSYLFNSIPYLGKDLTLAGEIPVSEYYVKELTRTIHGSNRNVTGDNWFTSVPLVDDLLKAPYNLTYVGQIRSNKKELPESVKNTPLRPIQTSLFLFGDGKMIVSYKPEKNKVLLLISSQHDEPEVNANTGTPTIIHSYNETKGAVDTLDEMCNNVSSSRRTRRWPLCMFYGMQNITYVNAYIIHSFNLTARNEKAMTRKAFNLELSRQLVLPQLTARLAHPNIQRNLKETISQTLGVSLNPQERPIDGARKICHFCPSKARRMTTNYCENCNQAMCLKHRALLCTTCLES